MKTNTTIKRGSYIITILIFFIIFVFFVIYSYMNKKYKEIDTAVDKQVQVSLNEFLDTLGQNGYQLQTISADEGDIKEAEETIFLSKEDKQKIIENVVSALSPAIYKELETKTTLEKQKVLDELEKTIDEKISKTIIDLSSEGFSDVDQETIVTAVSTIVESNILEILSKRDKVSEETINTIQDSIGENISSLENQINGYNEQLILLKAQYEKLLSDNKAGNQEYASFYKEYQEFLKKYANNMSVTLTTSNIVSSAELGAENDQQVLSAKAGNDLLNRINSLSSESSGSLEKVKEELQNQLTDNSEKISELYKVQEKLQLYAEAVKTGDEEARAMLQKELEEYSKGLDDATRTHIQEVIESTTDTIDKKLDAANKSISDLETTLSNNITENTTAIEDLQKKSENNSKKIVELNEIQEKLKEYTEAVKAGDEEARAKLQKELEEYSKGLDDATRVHIQEVIESTTDTIDKKLDAANKSISDLETELSNSITVNSTAIEKDKLANLEDINTIIAELKKLSEEADKDTDREKYEAALAQIADNIDGVWTPKDNVTPTKALSVYNSVINETKIENRITEVSDNIDSNMMKAEFSADGSTLTITVPSGN